MARLSIVLIIAMNVLICVFAEEAKYSDQYDNTDIEAEVLNVKDERDAYYNCFMKKAPCRTPKQEFFTGISVLSLNHFFSFMTDSFQVNLVTD